MAVVDLANGVTLGYESLGSGQPVVLLPGTGVDHQIFAPGGQLQALAEHFHVIAVDPRGTGQSSRPTETYGSRELVSDLLGLFDALQLERAHVVGLSFGSTIAQHFAADYPDRVNALVLYNTWGRTDEYLRRMFEIWRYFTATAEPLDYGRFILWWILSAGFINENPQVVDGIAAESFAGPGAAPRETHLQQLDINMTHDASGKLGTIRAPTLVLAGEVDRTVPSSYAEAVGKSIPSAITHILTGPTSSHGMVIEAGAEVNEHTISFLQAVDEGAPSRSR